MLHKLLQNEALKRAFHTFYQAFIPVFLAGVLNVLGAFQTGLGAGKSALLALLAAAVAAGISALKSAYLSRQ